MHSLRKWFYRPKKEDSSKLALFYWADEELTMVAAELDSFDGRTDPDRCSILVSQLRICQDKVLGICNDIMDEAIPDMRANRDFRAKFPDDVLHENLAGQLWFGAECLAAGSNIIHREWESASMRPLAKALTRSLENVRCLLREQSLKNSLIYSDKVREALRIFDRLFAEFELCYVSAMVPIKSAKEYHLQQEIVVLFSETLIRALKICLVTQDMVDDYDPSLMFTIPRLAIIWGLLLHPDGPFNVDKDSGDLSELFRPFCNLLFKIRDLLWTLTEPELRTLEKMLCSLEEPKIEDPTTPSVGDKILGANPAKDTAPQDDTLPQLYRNQLNCKQFIHDFYAYNFGIDNVPEDTQPPEEEEKKCHSGSIDLEVEFHNSCCEAYNRKSSDVPDPATIESDVVSGDFGLDEVFCQAAARRLSSRASERDCSNKDGCVTDCVCSGSGGVFLTAGSCSSCYRHSLDRTTSSLENHLTRLHKDCLCGTTSNSREHLTPSREIMRQVMRRVEIVPPGQRIVVYSTSVENSPRAYHHGLISHSFPTQPGHSSHGSRSSRRKTKRLSRRGVRNSSVCDTSPRRGSVPEAWVNSSPLTIPRVAHLRQEESEYSSCFSCQSVSSASSPEWDSTSPDTSSYNSECQDDEEIALALQAAEIASRNKARSRFKSKKDLLHKLFVCVSGVADQLQTNYASDLRHILKCVFDMNSQNQPVQPPQPPEPNPQSPSPDSPPRDTLLDHSVFTADHLLLDEEEERSSLDSAEEVVPPEEEESEEAPLRSLVVQEEGGVSVINGPPEWMPDELSSNCMACKVQFTILRRRHHCRNCGKIFCSRCSSNSIPLPRYGHLKPVRVCNQCFMYQLTNLVMQRQLF